MQKYGYKQQYKERRGGRGGQVETVIGLAVIAKGRQKQLRKYKQNSTANDHYYRGPKSTLGNLDDVFDFNENKGQPYIPQPATQYSTPGPTTALPQPSEPAVPTYGPQHVIVQQQAQPPQQTVLVVGGCPRCTVGRLEDEVTCCGILCCILFFPLGIICLFLMREKRCTNCGASF